MAGTAAGVAGSILLGDRFLLFARLRKTLPWGGSQDLSSQPEAQVRAHRKPGCDFVGLKHT
jgi:hypothetical protein